MPAGYSGTPRAQKLGVNDDQRTSRHQMPASVAEQIARGGLALTLLTSRSANEIEIAHVVVTRRQSWYDSSRSSEIASFRTAGSGSRGRRNCRRSRPTSTEDTIRAEALPLGFVDVKVCAIDDTWSTLKLVIRKSERTKM